MATRTTTATTPVIELTGKLAGAVRSLQLPGYQVESVVVPAGPGGAARLGANVSISPMSAEMTLVEQNALLDWALALAHGNPLPLAGAALLLDFNGVPTRRIEWTDALLTTLRLPTLDAASKLACSIELGWQPGTVTYAKPSGTTVKLPTVKKKALLSGNFRVAGLPFDGTFIRKVVLPTVAAKVATEERGGARLGTRHTSSIDLGELQLEFTARSRDEVLAWVQKVVADGLIADKDYLSVDVQLLDAAMKNVLLTVSMSGCALLAYDESRVEAGQETIATETLRFAVGKLDLKFAP